MPDFVHTRYPAEEYSLTFSGSPGWVNALDDLPDAPFYVRSFLGSDEVDLEWWTEINVTPCQTKAEAQRVRRYLVTRDAHYTAPAVVNSRQGICLENLPPKQVLEEEWAYNPALTRFWCYPVGYWNADMKVFEHQQAAWATHPEARLIQVHRRHEDATRHGRFSNTQVSVHRFADMSLIHSKDGWMVGPVELLEGWLRRINTGEGSPGTHIGFILDETVRQVGWNCVCNGRRDDSRPLTRLWETTETYLAWPAE